MTLALCMRQCIRLKPWLQSPGRGGVLDTPAGPVDNVTGGCQPYCQARQYYIDGETYAQLRRFQVHSGDLLMSCSGTIGRMVVVSDGAEPGVINQALLKLTLSASILLPRHFMALFANMLDDVLRTSTRGSAVKNLASVKALKSIACAMPPIAEQSRIVAALEEEQSRAGWLVGVASAELTRSSRLRQSILKWAFEGRLVDQDPDDEPASVLLERIRAEREAAKPTKRKRKKKASSQERLL